MSSPFSTKTVVGPVIQARTVTAWGLEQAKFCDSAVEKAMLRCSIQTAVIVDFDGCPFLPGAPVSSLLQ